MTMKGRRKRCVGDIQQWVENRLPSVEQQGNEMWMRRKCVFVSPLPILPNSLFHYFFYYFFSSFFPLAFHLFSFHLVVTTFYSSSGGQAGMMLSYALKVRTNRYFSFSPSFFPSFFRLFPSLFSGLFWFFFVSCPSQLFFLFFSYFSYFFSVYWIVMNL